MILSDLLSDLLSYLPLPGRHVTSLSPPCQVGEDVAWQRRLSRALAMAAGSKDASGMGNYEQLGTYAVAEEHAAIRADAAAAVAARGAAAVYPRAHDAAARTASDLSGAAGATTQTGCPWSRPRVSPSIYLSI